MSSTQKRWILGIMGTVIAGFLVLLVVYGRMLVPSAEYKALVREVAALEEEVGQEPSQPVMSEELPFTNEKKNPFQVHDKDPLYQVIQARRYQFNDGTLYRITQPYGRSRLILSNQSVAPFDSYLYISFARLLSNDLRDEGVEIDRGETLKAIGHLEELMLENAVAADSMWPYAVYIIVRASLLDDQAKAKNLLKYYLREVMNDPRFHGYGSRLDRWDVGASISTNLVDYQVEMIPLLWSYHGVDDPELWAIYYDHIVAPPVVDIDMEAYVKAQLLENTNDLLRRIPKRAPKDESAITMFFMDGAIYRAIKAIYEPVYESKVRNTLAAFLAGDHAQVLRDLKALESISQKLYYSGDPFIRYLCPRYGRYDDEERILDELGELREKLVAKTVSPRDYAIAVYTALHDGGDENIKNVLFPPVHFISETAFSDDRFNEHRAYLKSIGKEGMENLFDVKEAIPDEEEYDQIRDYLAEFPTTECLVPPIVVEKMRTDTVSNEAPFYRARIYRPYTREELLLEDK